MYSLGIHVILIYKLTIHAVSLNPLLQRLTCCISSSKYRTPKFVVFIYGCIITAPLALSFVALIYFLCLLSGDLHYYSYSYSF
jgi:hypothetical protein